MTLVKNIIAELCSELDRELYLPVKEQLDKLRVTHSLGFAKEDFKGTIERVVTQRINNSINTILDYPLGCSKLFSTQWGRCGEISFGNKIILCPNCAWKIVQQVETLR